MSETKDEARTLPLRLPLGVRSLLFDEAERLRRVEREVVGVLERRGFREAIFPVLDYLDPYSAVVGAGGRLYSFLDRDGERLALRADFTPMMARHLAPRLRRLPSPLRLFYRGDVVRYESPRAGRRREFFQVGAEIVGEASESGDREAFDLFLEAVGEGLAAGVVVFQFAGLLERWLGAAGAGERSRAVVVALENRSRSALRDAAPDLATRLEPFLVGELDPSDPAFAAAGLGGAIELLGALGARASEKGLRVAFDFADPAANGYYSGASWSFHAGRPGAPIASGGRYDRLFSLFGVDAPAVGFTVGLERLAAAGEGQ